MTLECAREQDVLDAVASGRWPGRADADLRAHARQCAACRDTAAIAAAFAEDTHTPGPPQPLPAASLIWWRAQVRAREEAARLALRPIAVVQAVATLCAAAASLAMAPAAAAWVRGALGSIGASGWWSASADPALSAAVAAAAYVTVPLLAAGLCIVLAPVIVFFALDD